MDDHSRAYITDMSTTMGLFVRRSLAIMLLSVVAACGSTPPIATNGPTQLVEAGALPPPGAADGLAADRGYLIGQFDRLIIDVFGFSELNARKIQVDASGRIELPLAGSMIAAGLTPSELSEQITAKLRAAYVRSPQVAVNVEESLSKLVTVEGQVTEPGNYPLINNMTLVRSIAAAKGLSEFAKLDDVVIFRTVNGKRMAALYNLEAIRRGYYVDPPVYAQDVIVVGNSPARAIFRDALQAAAILVSPLVTILAR